METHVIGSLDNQIGRQRGTLTETSDATASLDLFAEELSLQQDHAAIPGVCCVSSVSSVGSTYACVACFSTAC